MNRKGQVAFVAVMIGIVVIVLAIKFAPVLNEVVSADNVMGSEGLDCDNESISNMKKANCTAIDTIHPIYIIIMLGLAVMLLRRIAP